MNEPTLPPPGGLPAKPGCPFCGMSDTELMNPFGSQLSVATYWCIRCRSPFEVMKWTSLAAAEPSVGVTHEGDE